MRRINVIDWLHVLLEKLQRGLTDLGGSPLVQAPPSVGPRDAAGPGVGYQPLQRLRLTTGVAASLFDEYEAHRESERGDEETGWVLLGRRDQDEATAFATLPAGADREAGEAHVRFNSAAQAVASRIVRQVDRRLVILGVVHTHPGTLRHPSDGDFRGDSRWVGQLRGGEGIFGIGTAEGMPAAASSIEQPHPNMQCRRLLSFNWYSLKQGARGYRALPAELVDGPDLAVGLRSIWPILENHAERLDRLARMIAGLSFEVLPDATSPALIAVAPLPFEKQALRVVVQEKDVRYFLEREGALLQAELADPNPDRGVYQLLAALASDP